MGVAQAQGEAVGAFHGVVRLMAFGTVRFLRQAGMCGHQECDEQ
jgi:hypothetical protein